MIRIGIIWIRMTTMTSGKLSCSSSCTSIQSPSGVPAKVPKTQKKVALRGRDD